MLPPGIKRKSLGQRHDAVADFLNSACLLKIVEHLRNQAAYFDHVRFCKTPRRNGRTSQTDTARIQRRVGVERDRVLGLVGGPGSEQRATGSGVGANAVLEHDLSSDHDQVEAEGV